MARSYLLTQDGDYILTENGNRILLTETVPQVYPPICYAALGDAKPRVYEPLENDTVVRPKP